MDLLWEPSQKRIKSTQLFQFMQQLKDTPKPFETFQEVYDWSIQKPQAFWKAFWSFAKIKAQTTGNIVFHHDPVFWKSRFFPEATLNFAENLLIRRDKSPAIIFWGEDRARETMTFAQLYQQAQSLSTMFNDLGIQPNDHIAAVLPNKPEAVIGMLASAWLGATWSSCSPDFGVSGLLDRLGQIQPKILLFTDSYFYNGKKFDCLPKLELLLQKLPSVESVIIVPYLSHLAQPYQAPEIKTSKTIYSWQSALEKGQSLDPVPFTQVPFNHPLYILFSSGTTGVPKCIVHGTGGTLLEHLKEHRLHCDIQPGDKVFYFTTCSWMMWNWLVSALASQATLLLYDGSPFYRNGNILFEFAQATEMTLFGTSAKFLEACEKFQKEPGKNHDLSALKSILSTGSPLAPERFEYVYRAFKSDVLLSSVSGGTDIVGCFLAGNPIGPVWKGELQGPSLGYDLDVWDRDGNALNIGDKGELVCKAPFPSMPLNFWNDPTGEKFQNAYFSTYPNIWHHGDFVSKTAHGGMIIHGRSDATLNPGGVRIGTSEIYRQVEKIPEVLESVAVGQKWNHDVRVILFVKLLENQTLDEALIHKIKEQIRQETTPRHVPSKVIAVPDIPKTHNGKIVEMAVFETIHHLPVKNKDALENPKSLDFFEHIEELKKD